MKKFLMSIIVEGIIIVVVLLLACFVIMPAITDSKVILGIVGLVISIFFLLRAMFVEGF